MLKKMGVTFFVMLGLLFVGGIQEAQAIPITGTVQLTGSFVPKDQNGFLLPGQLVGATGVHITGNVATVASATGTFGVLSIGSTVTYNDFDFNPVAITNPIWSGQNFTFTLNTMTGGVLPGNILSLTGTGVIHYSGPGGYTDTVGTWSFYGDPLNHDFFKFTSGTTASTSVPEPASLLLLGGGLTLVGVTARRRKLI